MAGFWKSVTQSKQEGLLNGDMDMRDGMTLTLGGRDDNFHLALRSRGMSSDDNNRVFSLEGYYRDETGRQSRYALCQVSYNPRTGLIQLVQAGELGRASSSQRVLIRSDGSVTEVH
jgi:hypothetical protein